MRRIPYFALVLIVPGLALAGPPPGKLDPAQPYHADKLDPVTFDVDFSVVVTPPAGTKLLKVWLPLPPSDVAQELKRSSLSTFPVKVVPTIAKEKVYGNQFAHFAFEQPQGAQVIRHQYTIQTWELRWKVDAAKVSKVGQWPNGFQPYLQGDRSIVLDDRMRKTAVKIVGRSQGPAADLAELMEWINRNIKYDHAAASLEANAAVALTNRAGNCSAYHGLCAAFGRALGYPTRLVYGIHPFPKNSPSHCKLECFLPPYGWVCFDVSETQHLLDRIAKDTKLGDRKKADLAELATKRLRDGFRDNTWILLTRGTDYDLAPPASKRVPVVRTIYAEADGLALPEPDPANAKKREFSWMTVHQYTPDRPIVYPFADWRSLVAKW